MKKGFTVLIDPGHGGQDPGAVANALKEADINYEVAEALEYILSSEGIAVHLTREEDQTSSLYRRVWIENRLQPDLFISLHCNAAGTDVAKGIEVFTSPGDTGADPAAEHIIGALKRTFPDRHFRTDCSDGDQDKEARFYVLRNTACPAVLVEMGFLTNAEDAAWISSPTIRNQIALALAKGILVWRKEGAA